jgi:hypothetical protein
LSLTFTTSQWLDRAEAWNYNTTYTVSMWVKITSPADASLFSVGPATGTSDGEELDEAVAASTFGSIAKLGGNYDGAVVGTVSFTSAWIFVAYRRISATQMDLYVNNGVDATGATYDISTRPAAGKFGIGTWFDWLNGAFAGDISQVRIWTTNLSNAELALEKTHTRAQKTANLWAEYSLESSGTATTDLSGNNRTLTSHGSPTTGSTEPTGQSTQSNVVFDSSGSGAGVGSVTNITWSHTIGSGSNRLLLVSFSWQIGPSWSVPTVTYNGVSMTFVLSSSQVAWDYAVCYFILKESSMPAAGAHTVSVTVDNSYDIAGTSTSWSNVDQTTALHNTTSATGNDGTPTVNVTSATGEMVVAAHSTRGDPANLVAITCDHWELARSAPASGTTYMFNIQQGNGGAATVTMSPTQGGTNSWLLVAGSLAPVSGITANGGGLLLMMLH